MDEVILLAKMMPKGLVQIVFTTRAFTSKTNPIEILDNSQLIVGTFNTDKRNDPVMFRSVIVIDPQWSNNFRVFQSQYGLTDKYLKPYERATKKD